MTIFILSSIGLLSVIFLGASSYRNDIYEYSKFKYNEWIKLNSMMSLKYKHPVIIKIMSVYMIFKFSYLQIIQYLTNSVIKIDKNHYEISYIINGKLYKIIVRHKRGPSHIHKIIDGKNNDITDSIMEYHGPNQKKISPSFFNSEFFVVHHINGDLFTIKEFEELEL